MLIFVHIMQTQPWSFSQIFGVMNTSLTFTCMQSQPYNQNVFFYMSVSYTPM